jgi:hypothetical protein
MRAIYCYSGWFATVRGRFGYFVDMGLASEWQHNAERPFAKMSQFCVSWHTLSRSVLLKWLKWSSSTIERKRELCSF